MTRKLGLTLATALVLAGTGIFGSVTEGGAQTLQDRSGAATAMSAQRGQGSKGKGNAGSRNVGQQRNAGQQRNVGQQRIISQPRNFGQQQRNVGKQRIVSQPRNVGQQRRNVGQQPKIDRQRNVGQRNIGQKQSVAQPGRGLSSASIRGANRASIAGRNFSIWRGSHRVRRGGQWRTFVGLSALTAVMVGTAYYYPYAYIDAPAAYCEGLTEDGCQLQWQEVPTLEGPTEFQCVAYCPR